MNNIFRITAFAIVDIISSCSTMPAVKVGQITDRYSNERSAAYESLTPSVNEEKINSTLEELFAIIKENSPYASTNTTFVTKFNSFMSYFSDLIDGITIYRTRYYDTGENENRTKYTDCIDLYYSLIQNYHDLLDAAYKSNYRTVLFGDMSDEEIQDIIDSYESNEETKQYTLKLEEYSNDAEEIYRQSYKESNYVDSMYELLVKYMETAHAYGDYLGDNYLDYVYDNTYDRNYTTKDMHDFYSAVKNDLVPAATVYKAKIDSINLSSSDKKFITMLDSYNFRYYELDILPEIEEYVYSIDPLSTAYKNLWSNKGLYCFSNSENSLGSAFTTNIRSKSQPIMFFSRNYQDTFTFIHEFGHYANFYTTSGVHYPMDISEIDSQGNEMLFASFLLENYEKFEFSQELIEYINATKVYSQLNSIINCSFVSEMEETAYNYENLSDKNAFLRKIDDVCDSYGGLAYKKYWWAPVLTNFGYYISYATSSIGALQLYVNSRNNYDDAVKSYIKFIRRACDTSTIDTITDAVGLLQIYGKDAVKYIADYIKKQ